jgi:predicted dehydrogenase
MNQLIRAELKDKYSSTNGKQQQRPFYYYFANTIYNVTKGRCVMTIRVGIIGAGYGAQVHAPILQRHPDYEVLAISSLRPGRADTVATSLGIPNACYDWHSMLNDIPLDERQAVKKALEDHTIGDIFHVNWTEAWPLWPRIRDDQNSWQWQVEKCGGMLGAVGSHMIDALQHWFGPFSIL